MDFHAVLCFVSFSHSRDKTDPFTFLFSSSKLRQKFAPVCTLIDLWPQRFGVGQDAEQTKRNDIIVSNFNSRRLTRTRPDGTSGMRVQLPSYIYEASLSWMQLLCFLILFSAVDSGPRLRTVQRAQCTSRPNNMTQVYTWYRPW